MERPMSNLSIPRAAVLVLCVMSFTAACAAQPRSSTAPSSSAQLAQAYGRLPLHFEENRGQADPSARFVARTGGGPVFLGADGLDLAVDGPPVRLSIEGRDPLPGRVNYYVDSDPARWRSDIPTFARVRYTAVYPGIDVVVYGNQRQLEYDFMVAPGADPRTIRVRIDGADSVAIDG